MYLYKRFHSVDFLSIHHLWTWNSTGNITIVFLINHFVHVSLVNISSKDIANVYKGKYVIIRLNQEENRNFYIWDKLFQLCIILRGHRYDPYNRVTSSLQRHVSYIHDDVIKWKHFPRYWPFCVGNSPVTCEFLSQRPVARSFDVFFDLRLNKRLCKQSRRRWFHTRRAHYDVTLMR